MDRIERAKREILEDVKAGVVPADVEAFSDLHYFVDANGYGGFFEDDAELEDANPVFDAVDLWIKGGGIAAALKEND